MTEAATATQWLAGLPKKRIAVSGIFCDDLGRVLLLSRTYADGWVLPGGIVEAGESPATAFTREVEEETGLRRKPGPILCVDWVAAQEGCLDGIVIVFDGGFLSSSDVSALALPNSEISGFRLTACSDLAALDCRARRIAASMRSREGSRVVYLESDGS